MLGRAQFLHLHTLLDPQPYWQKHELLFLPSSGVSPDLGAQESSRKLGLQLGAELANGELVANKREACMTAWHLGLEMPVQKMGFGWWNNMGSVHVRWLYDCVLQVLMGLLEDCRLATWASRERGSWTRLLWLEPCRPG